MVSVLHAAVAAVFARTAVAYVLSFTPSTRCLLVASFSIFWDIALTSWADGTNFPAIQPYHIFALDGPSDWVLEEPELQRLYAQLLRTVDREHQQALIRQMERHTRDQAYFLFLYNPIKLCAVNKAVEFVPYVNTSLNLAETSVTEQHWSVRKQGAAVQE